MADDLQDANESEKVRFTVDSGLLYQLGEELVARPSLALAELVKNAYDADATEVTVSMHDVHEPGGRIVVKDNGNGMTIEELRSGWMRIAAPGKRTQAYSRRFHRPLTGAKGVGRFAARRLGRTLLLRSIASGEDINKQQVEVKFNWAKDFRPGRELTTIGVPVKHGDAPEHAHTGVELRIAKTRDAWAEHDLRVLIRDLTSLQSPFPDLVRDLQVDLEQHVRDREPERADPEADQDPGFKFTITVDGQPFKILETSEITEDLLNRAVAILDGEVIEVEELSSDGQIVKVARASYHLKFPRTKAKEMTLVDLDTSYSGLVGVRFRIYMFRFQREHFTDSSILLRDAQRIGRENGGVRVYLNGFRVFPYGDQGDDWLEFDATAARNTNFGSLVDAEGFIQSTIAGAGTRAFLRRSASSAILSAMSTPR